MSTLNLKEFIVELIAMIGTMKSMPGFQHNTKEPIRGLCTANFCAYVMDIIDVDTAKEFTALMQRTPGRSREGPYWWKPGAYGPRLAHLKRMLVLLEVME